MLKVRTFRLTSSLLSRSEVAEMNAFLATHKPENIQYFPGQAIVAYDDGEFSPEYAISNWKSLKEAALAAKDQQEIAKHMLEYERADLNPTHNKGRFEELSAGISNCMKMLSLQEEKVAYCDTRIAALRENEK
jgi:hypothetical protein